MISHSQIFLSNLGQQPWPQGSKTCHTVVLDTFWYQHEISEKIKQPLQSMLNWTDQRTKTNLYLWRSCWSLYMPVELRVIVEMVAVYLLFKVRKDSKWWIYTLRVLFPFIIKLNERESWKVSTNLRSLVCNEDQACHQNAQAPKNTILWKDISTICYMFKPKIPRNLI